MLIFFLNPQLVLAFCPCTFIILSHPTILLHMDWAFSFCVESDCRRPDTELGRVHLNINLYSLCANEFTFPSILPCLHCLLYFLCLCLISCFSLHYHYQSLLIYVWGHEKAVITEVLNTLCTLSNEWKCLFFHE